MFWLSCTSRQNENLNDSKIELVVHIIPAPDAFAVICSRQKGMTKRKLITEK